jgi:oligoendopeptidase F
MELTHAPDVTVPPRRFVPDGYDPLDKDALEAHVAKLLERPIGSPDELRDWIHDASELGSQIAAGWARYMTAMNRDTKSEELKQRNLDFQRRIMPVWESLADKLNHRYLESPHRGELDPTFTVFDRSKANAAEIFREENAKLGAEEQELEARYQEVQGNFTVVLDGKELTAPQAATRLEERDRAVREEAFRALGDRHLQDADTVDEIYDGLVALRDRKGRNADFENYRDFRFAQAERFDYTPADCEGFHAAAEKIVVPAARELIEYRRRRLELDSLRPWDTAVSLFGRPPRKYFEDEQGYIDLLRRLFTAIDPLFAEDFEILVRNGLLDLMSRPGKAPGAYNCPVEDIRLPFIFGNATGVARDVSTLLHEGGHAFHTIACRGNPVLDYRRSPAEFAEVASMSMEFFGLERLELVFGAEVAREMAYDQLVSALLAFPRIACVDAFQHWVYTHPKHTRNERREAWLDLAQRFGLGVDWSGLEHYRAAHWQKVPHLFTHPLYFIEYGIAQLGALQMWRNEREDHDRAVAGYRRGLALGGSRPLPELFHAAGLRFAMDEEIFAELIPFLVERIREVAPD